MLTTTAGCVQAAGPVYGSWHGTQPGPITNYPKEVELVLNGLPGAQSGTYRIASTQQGPGATVDSGTRRWGDSWSSEQRVEDGVPQTIIHLHNTLPGDISTYALAADGTLRVVHPNGQVDRSPAAKYYVLFPATRDARYGRD